ncbi:GWxTD domain-containing protein, partial [Rubrivirga sp.]|uniref:GWxTD domain-containing protein n=1 Tax=Rubrivirga sp. TaxID=1885344 RepID=UPI003C77D13E
MDVTPTPLVCRLAALALVLAGCSAPAVDGVDLEAATLVEQRTPPPDSVQGAYLRALRTGLEVERHVAQAAALLPDSLRAALEDGTADGQDLAAWWQARDPLPLTPTNERLAEHLRRVAEAERRYPDGSGRGYDDRGEALVRLGEPVSVRRARSRNQTLSRSLMMAGPPDNEVWDYGLDGVVLFVEVGRSWRRGGPLDLLPPGLRSPKVGAREQQWSVLSTLFLHDILNGLAPAERGYGRLFDRLDVVLNGPGGISESALERGLTPLGLGETITQRLDGGQFGVDGISPAFFDEVETEQRRIDHDRPVLLDATVPPVPQI